MEVGGHWPVLGDKKTHEWPPRTQKKEKGKIDNWLNKMFDFDVCIAGQSIYVWYRCLTLC